VRKLLTYNIHDIVPYINWIYFYFAWGLSQAKIEERKKLREEANDMLGRFDAHYHTYAVFDIFDANSDGDDLILSTTRIPLLRQQHTLHDGDPYLCLSDFVRPFSSGVSDKVGAFATTVEMAMEKDEINDDFEKMMKQTLADRLAEATAEKMHEEVRKIYWGYASDEQLKMEDLWIERFQGIRPAVGYPSLPDQSLNFLLNEMLQMKDIGIRLTENGAMKPHASVSGLMISHPAARYFSVGKIGNDQLNDYSRRRGVPVELMKKFLAANL
jgi:cobalamin-dependent methionine synthase I